MALNAHEKSGYKPRRLPRCSKCNMEFMLVAANYPESRKTIEEWECPKCHKAVPRELLKEEPIPTEESFIHDRCMRMHEQDERRKRRNRK